jgi:hypothetical protein
MGAQCVSVPEIRLVGSQLLSQGMTGGFMDIVGAGTAFGEWLDVGEPLKFPHKVEGFVLTGNEQGRKKMFVEPMRDGGCDKCLAEARALGLRSVRESYIKWHKGECRGVALCGAQDVQEALFVCGVHA